MMCWCWLLWYFNAMLKMLIGGTGYLVEYKGSLHLFFKDILAFFVAMNNHGQGWESSYNIIT